MTSHSSQRTNVAGTWWIGISCFIAGMASLRAAAPEQVPPSRYAPVKDLRGQLDFFVQRITEDLANEAEYGEEQQGRVAKDAHTIAALALVLGMHDEKHDAKSTATGLIEASGKLANSAKDLQSAKEALAQLKLAFSKSSEVKPLEWKPVADLGQLMKQVPIVNNNLRRTVTGRRFKQSLDSAAGQAVTLSAIAQVSSFDKIYCENEDDEQKWGRLCGEMRDLAAEVQVAVRAGDQAAATTGLDKLAKTCDACHHAFRDK